MATETAFAILRNKAVAPRPQPLILMRGLNQIFLFEGNAAVEGMPVNEADASTTSVPRLPRMAMAPMDATPDRNRHHDVSVARSCGFCFHPSDSGSSSHLTLGSTEGKAA